MRRLKFKNTMLFFMLSCISLNAQQEDMSEPEEDTVQQVDDATTKGIDEIRNAMAVITEALCAAYSQKTKGCCCTQGPRGPRGATGPAGATGATGATGAPG